MKKVYISVPTEGRTEASIANSILKMHKIAELTFGEELEPITPYLDNISSPANSNSELFVLGKCLEYMAMADYFVGIQHIGYSKRSNTEGNIASRFDIPSIRLSVYDCVFLKDIKDIDEEYYRSRYPRRDEEE